LAAECADPIKAKIFMRMGEVDRFLAQGADEGIQLASVVSTAVQAFTANAAA